MKIAFVLLDAEITGGQIVALELMRAVRDGGHEPIAISPQPGPLLERLHAEQIPAHVQPLRHSYRIDQAIRLARLFRRERIDLVNTHTLFVGDQLTRLAATVARVPVVAHAHIEERFSSKPRVASVQRLLARATSQRCAAFVAVSRYVGEALVRNGVARRKISVIHNGVRISPPAAWSPSAELRVVCVARLAPVKGQSVLLHALAEAGEGVVMSFVGSDLERHGAYRAELERTAAELGVADRARFLGQRDDVNELLEHADALALASFDEGLPLVVLEAMERSRAVVATAAGGTPELVVDGETGILTALGAHSELAAALRRLRDEPGIAERLGAAGRARVEREFSLERQAGETLAVFEAAAGG